MQKKSISKRQKQAISKNEGKKWYKEREEENPKINPLIIVAGIGYVILGAGAIIALAYFANENLQ